MSGSIVLLVPTHFIAHWHHDVREDPIRIYEEVGDDRTELRKIEEFRDGTLVRTASMNDGPTSLSWGPMPDIVEIDDQPEFSVEMIGAEQFDTAWARATDALP